MPEHVAIVTPEHVELNYELAGLGSRFVAALVDHLIQGVALTVLLVGGGLVLGVAGNIANLPAWVLAGLIVLAFLIGWGYFVLFETRANGQTPGKRVVGIRVIRDGGYPVDFRAAVIRNLVRYADFLPSMYGVGTLSIFFSGQCKRLGDYAAGTLVVKERGRKDVLPQVAPTDAPSTVPPLDESLAAALSRLAVKDYQVMRHFLDRNAQLEPATAIDLARRILAPILVKLGRDPNTMPADPRPLLASIADAYEARRRH